MAYVVHAQRLSQDINTKLEPCSGAVAGIVTAVTVTATVAVTVAGYCAVTVSTLKPPGGPWQYICCQRVFSNYLVVII